jgi:uncharacterized protein YbaR (Trm112 family)
MAVADFLLEILVCPACQGPLVYQPAAPERLVCRRCRLAYAVDDSIPNMIVEEAAAVDDAAIAAAEAAARPVAG